MILGWPRSRKKPAGAQGVETGEKGESFGRRRQKPATQEPRSLKDAGEVNSRRSARTISPPLKD
jgi:hypothetical protein